MNEWMNEWKMKEGRNKNEGRKNGRKEGIHEKWIKSYWHWSFVFSLSPETRMHHKLLRMKSTHCSFVLIFVKIFEKYSSILVLYQSVVKRFEITRVFFSVCTNNVLSIKSTRVFKRLYQPFLKMFNVREYFSLPIVC